MACLVRSPDLGQLGSLLAAVGAACAPVWLPASDSPSSQQVGVEGQERQRDSDPAVWLNGPWQKGGAFCLRGSPLRRKGLQALGLRGIQPCTGASPLTVSLHVWALWTPRNSNVCNHRKTVSFLDPGIYSTPQSGAGVGMTTPTAFDLFTGDKMRSEAIIIHSDDFK